MHDVAYQLLYMHKLFCSVFEHLQSAGFTDDGFADLDVKTGTSLLLSTAHPNNVTSGRTM